MADSETPRWLRDQLTRHLGSMSAPEELWDRIQNGGKAGIEPHHYWTRWAVAAVLTMATALGTYWLPEPQLRSNVVVLAASDQPDLRQDDPAEWDLRCAPPASHSTFRVANLSAQKGHQFALAASGQGEGAMSCNACHFIDLNQHHL